MNTNSITASAAPPSGPGILRVQDLTVLRGGTIILDRVNWEVRRGCHWVILGSNGSGKTSLLAALTGYLTPSGGSIEMLGQRYGRSDWPALRRRIGLVSPALRHLLHEDEPALEIVIAGRYAAIDLRGRPLPADVRRARRLLREVGCSALALRPWAILSQGERQRVLIARARMAEPEILILDEPCASLDPVAREEFLGFLAGLARRARPALILVTHHLEEIVAGFEHALVLKGGRVLAAGPAGRVLRSGILSAAFESTVRVRRRHGRLRLAVATPCAWGNAQSNLRPTNPGIP